MPEALEKELRRKARQLVLAGKLKKKDFDAYVYGGLRRSGWVPKREIK